MASGGKGVPLPEVARRPATARHPRLGLWASIMKPLRYLRFGILPPGLALMGRGDALEDSPTYGWSKCNARPRFGISRRAR